jgi:sarcosine oxidase, subunit gamma
MTSTTLRRSFLRVPLNKIGASWTELAGAEIAARIPGENAGAAVVLRDLSILPRTGFKGAESPTWMESQGVVLPSAPNLATRQADGSLVARLAPGEFLILGPLGGDNAPTDRLDKAWSIDTAGFCFQLPRRDSHAWLHLSGDKVTAMFAKICGVDLREKAFADLAIAQTSVARLSAIVIRDDRAGKPGYHLLADSASAIYLWESLEDAMTEFSGSIAGYASLDPA